MYAQKKGLLLHVYTVMSSLRIELELSMFPFPPLEVSAKRQILYGNMLAIKTVSAICYTAELANITSSTYVGAIIAVYSCSGQLAFFMGMAKVDLPSSLKPVKTSTDTID
jgi:hypothetical protein